MSEGKWPGAQTMKHAEDSQAGANGVSRLHRDEAGDPSGGVSRHQFCNQTVNFYFRFWLMTKLYPDIPFFILTPKGVVELQSNCLQAWDQLLLYASFPLVWEFVTWKLEALCVKLSGQSSKV